MQVLLIEDNRGDAILVKLGFRDAAPDITLNWETSAEAGLDTLDCCLDPYDLIILDLNLPRMSGAEFVVEFVKRPQSENIPIMILSSAPASQIVGTPLGNRPVGYLTKPSDLEGYRSIGKYVARCLETSQWTSSPDIPIRLKKAH